MGTPWTPEQKAAAKARYAARKNKNPETKNGPTPEVNMNVSLSTAEQQGPMAGPQPESIPQMQNVDVGELMRRIQELEQRQFFQPPQQEQPQVNRQGKLVGSHVKYTLDPGYYPDPCERLSNEPRLQRFAFKANYELKLVVETAMSQTQDGVNTREPKFTIELYRIMYDEETGLPTNGRYTVCRMIFFEDPDSALVVARDNNVDIDATGEKEFLDEMRYLRVRDWLLEAFYPPKAQTKSKKREMVIGNKVVEYFEINSETSETMPFSQLKTKV